MGRLGGDSQGLGHTDTETQTDGAGQGYLLEGFQVPSCSHLSS